jgi:hypothetical protein
VASSVVGLKLELALGWLMYKDDGMMAVAAGIYHGLKRLTEKKKGWHIVLSLHHFYIQSFMTDLKILSRSDYTIIHHDIDLFVCDCYAVHSHVKPYHGGDSCLAAF